MNVLLLGSAGREHALAWKLAQSPRLEALFVCPGNPGTALVAKTHNRPISATDAEGLIALCRAEQIGLCIVGPEQPLVEGVADALREGGIPVVGPGREGARLEGSKAFSKRFMLEEGIPTAPARMFTLEQLEEARAFVSGHALPVVIKADGLAAGKGVVVAKTHAEALEALEDMLVAGRFGDAGAEVLVEEFMPGREMSFFVLADGRRAIFLPEAQDHKRAYDNDEGPNTGGMGAVSPVAMATLELKDKVEDLIVLPTLSGLVRRGISYQGFLFIGLMIGEDGSPRVVEYNCRLGDPETQAILPRLEADLLELCQAAATGMLQDLPETAKTSAETTVAVVLASKGYPDAPESGLALTGLEEAGAGGALIYHAGTAETNDRIISSGGRVLTMVGRGTDLDVARSQAYEALEAIRLEGSFFRKDIGQTGSESGPA